MGRVVAPLLRRKQKIQLKVPHKDHIKMQLKNVKNATSTITEKDKKKITKMNRNMKLEESMQWQYLRGELKVV